MRKSVQLFIVIVLSLNLLGSSKANMDGIFLYEFPKQSLLYDSLDLKSIRFAGELFILPEGEFNQKEAASIINRVMILPDPMLEKAVDNNIKIKLFEGSLTDNPTVRHLKGVIPRGYSSKKTWDQVPGIGGAKLVLVKIGSSEKGSGHSSVNLELHELAHTLDRHVYGEIRNDSEFLRLWKLESRLLFPGRSYFLNFPEEYFAESFAMFYIGGIHARLLHEAAPQTYQFLKLLN